MNEENIYEEFGSEAYSARNSRYEGGTIAQPVVSPNNEVDTNDHVQWAYRGDGNWQGCGITAKELPARTYGVTTDDRGRPIFRTLNIVTDDLVRLPDAATDYVLSLIEKFWASKDAFKKRGYLFKRGILLCGSPGGGKTSIIQLLSNQLLDLGGIVCFAEHPSVAAAGLRILRQIEPERPLICILEDLDELVSRFGEAEWLALLDGESQIDNVVYIGTTNYPRRLDRRFINRPSRFDEIVVVDMPTDDARRAYLQAKSNGDLSEADIERWVSDTQGMSLAHLREIYIAVFCLGNTYETVLDRIKKMQKGRLRDSDDMGSISGFSK